VLIGLDHHGPRLAGAPRAADVEGNLRADGSVITSSLPTISLDTSEAGLLEPID
jgi:alpha,alpha-trehalose phosphorylase